jgi:hypothetical protein
MTTKRRSVKTLRRRGRLALFAGLVLALVGACSGVTFAAFTSVQGSPGNTVTAAPDWRAPTVTGDGGRLTGPLGYIKQGDSLYLFLNVTDTGNPASGVASVTASVTIPGSGTFSMPMTAGSYTVRGQTYNYRSAAQATPPTLAEQTLEIDVIATDNAGNTSTPTFPVVVDNTAPGATDIQTANGSTLVGRAQQSDTVTYTFAEAMDPETFLAGWTGSSQNVTVRLINGGVSNDTLQIWNAANTAQLPLGTVNLGRTDYTTSAVTFTASTMVMTGSTIRVTLGTTAGTATTAAATGTAQWTPVTTAKDLAGNAMSATVRSETGTADKEF